MIRLRLLLCIISVALASVGMAQEKVLGVVLDSNGKPVKRIGIQMQGKMRIMKTSSKGTFELKHVRENDTLMVYPNKEKVAYVPLMGEPTCTIHLGENSLRYVYGGKAIVCLYENAPKASYTNNIITSQQIQESGANNLVDLLRGNIAGLQVDYADGRAKATIRGVSSISLNTEPLFIIGGSEYHSLEDASNAISVRDIHEIEVKKDGAEYGMKGANGVIIIKTK